MLLKVYTVYDSKAEAFLNPMFFPTKGLAVRAFTVAANTADHDFHRYAADYTLFEIGEYDNSIGRVSHYEAFMPLGTALEYIKMADEVK